MYEWVFAALIVFAASVLQAATGFGFAIMATPFLLLVFDSRDCIQMSIILSFFIAIVLTPKIKDKINYSLLKRLIVGSIFGIPLGVLFFAYVSLGILKISVSVIILLITFMLLYKSYRNNKLMDQPEEGNLDKEKTSQLLVGLFSGMLTSGLGMPGVPLAVYYGFKNTDKEVVRSTTLAFFIVVYLISMMAQMLTVKISLTVIYHSLYLIPVAGLGVIFGNVLFKRINQKMFQIITNSILLYTGIYMFVKSI